MVYDSIIKGKRVSLRSITLEDAEFSYNIRKQPKIRDMVGRPASSLEEQIKYIKNQMTKSNDYYFVVENNNQKIGLTGVYDIKNDCAEIGRTVGIGSPIENIEASFLLEKNFCMDYLGLKKVYFVVYKNNLHQIHLVKKGGAYIVDEVLRNYKPCFLFEKKLDDYFLDFYKRTTKMMDMIDAI